MLRSQMFCGIAFVSAIIFSFLGCTFNLSDSANNRYFEFDSTSGTIIGYSDDGPKDVTLPSSIKGVRVTAVGRNAFRGKQLTGVNIFTSITAIGEGAFAENMLTSVLMLDSVVTIGANAFENNQLNTIDIPNSVIIIGKNAFANNHLISIDLGNSVTTIGEEAFAVNQLSGIEIPDSVTTIEEDAFSGNPLTSVTIGPNKNYASNIVPNFGISYNDNGKQAGTYKKQINGTWIMQL